MAVEKKKPVWSWTDAVAKADVPPLTKLVCLNIARYLSSAGKGWSISIEEMMADTGLGNQALSKHLWNAVDAGLLVIERVHNKYGHREGTTYTPRFPDDTELAREPADMGRGERKGATVTPFSDDQGRPGDAEAPENRARKGETVTPKRSKNIPADPSVPRTSRRAPGLSVRDTSSLSVRDTSRRAGLSVPRTSDLSVPRTSAYKDTFQDNSSPDSNPPLFPSLPEKDDRPDCEFCDGQIVLRGASRAYWLDRFGGDEERLELGLIQAAGFVQPNSPKLIGAQVNAQLARQLADKLDRDQRYAAAAARKSAPRGDSKVQAYLAKRRLEAAQ